MFKKHTIFVKLLSNFIIMSMLLISVIYFLSYNLVKKRYISRLSKQLELQCESTFSLIESDLVEKKYDILDKRIKDISKSINARITVINPQGKVIVESNADRKIMENHRSRLELSRALNGVRSRVIRYSSTTNQDMLYIAKTISRKDRVAYVIRLAVSLKEIDKLLGELRTSIVQAYLIIFILSVIVAFIFSRNIAKPISSLSLACKNMKNGEFQNVTDSSKIEEIKILSKSFNEMSSQIQKMIGTLEDKNRELETILDSFNEIVWVQDYSGVIVKVNSAFKRLFPAKSYDNKYIWELIYDPEIKEVIDQVKPFTDNITEEIEVNEKSFIISSAKIDEKRVVFGLHDLTSIRYLDKLKKDFVLNAGHELRTPLTAIKGFSEHLLESANDDNRRYLQIIKRNTDRLIYLVNDIQALAKLEQKKKLDLQELNLKEFFAQGHYLYEEKLERDNITLSYHIANDIPRIKADRFKFEQIFINLIDNAMRYTPKGGKIDIIGKKEADEVIIEIKDNGIGIPKEHLPRIFERFYVADKARNKKVSGTGLGLAIVKHIVELHNGSISVESEAKKGTKFIMRFKSV